MKVYLVGGAVRDRLIGRIHKENDWVVVGSTPEEMIALGFKPVGKDFPVFLHPETHEEYALARTERKTAKGYHGFTFYTSKEVTLEEDLRRRDLTMNAIAETKEGKLIDPYHGQQDIHNKIFRHVSEAFEEDPVRLLRVCRFACIFPDFSIAPETLKLMQKMVALGEVNALVPERVWKEFQQGLGAENPQRFFEVLEQTDALTSVFPEINSLREMEALKKSVVKTNDSVVRFACAFATLSLEKITALCQRLRVPNEYIDLTKLVIKQYPVFKQLNIKDPEMILSLLEKLDPFRRETRFNQYLLACECLDDSISVISPALKKAFQACQTLVYQPIDNNLSGIEIARMIRQQRLNIIKIFIL